MKNVYDVIIIGAGPSGIGQAIALKNFNIDNFLVLEKGKIGNSFLNWPKETHFLTPSFPANQFNLHDLNSISFDTSPGFSLRKERLSGGDYAEYLNLCTKYFKLNIKENTEVIDILQEKDYFVLKTNKEDYFAKFIIFALGEYSFPNKNFKNVIHTSEIKSFKKIKGEEVCVIGSYESAFDAMINLVNLGKKVKIFADFNYLNFKITDPSRSLSPRTLERVNNLPKNSFKIINTKVLEVNKKEGLYFLKTGNGIFKTKVKPIDATGFFGKNFLQEKFFDYSNEGFPIVSLLDESLKHKNIFLVGPKLKQQNILFCFIFKFRQRFAVIASEIANRLKCDKNKIEEVLNIYKKNNFILEDCSGCSVECAC